ncbi:cobalt-precorrin-7 (C(5))-methyltransferase [Pseudaeromonas sp. ZJS20]|uniref:cobalt-precorrin-7 (C(5))-methyltransferase n=1 Tax=Pseudaeromonas aegiceratis TaxID=3153928 RepID=UPI00390CA980
MINVIGIGPGDRQYLTQAAQGLIDQAEILAGWPRALAGFPEFGGQKVTLNAELPAFIAWLSSVMHKQVVVLASGDPMLFGIGKRIGESLPEGSCRMVPGISAIQYLFSRLGLDMNDIYLTSSHGKTPDFDFWFLHDKLALVTDQQCGPHQVAQALLARGLRRTLVVGENLSYDNERIHLLLPEQVAPTYDMNVVVVLK